MPYDAAAFGFGGSAFGFGGLAGFGFGDGLIKAGLIDAFAFPAVFAVGRKAMEPAFGGGRAPDEVTAMALT